MHFFKVFYVNKLLQSSKRDKFQELVELCILSVAMCVMVRWVGSCNMSERTITVDYPEHRLHV